MATCANGSPPIGLSWQNITVSNDGKAITRGIGVGVGSPHQQIFALVPSLADDNTWLFNAADCVSAANSTCIGQKGGVYNQSLSHSFVQTTQGQWNGVPQAIELQGGSFIFFNDDFYFGSNGTLPAFPLLLNQPGHGSGSGLGLGPQSTFLDAAVKSGSAPSKAFGMWVGSRSENSPADGALWLGAYDSARVAHDFTDFTIPVGGCPFCVKITNITYITHNSSTSLFSNSSEFLEVNLEPFEHSLEVTSDIFTNFLRASNGKVGTDPGTTGLVTLPPNADLGNLSVTFDNGYTTVIPSSELFLPPRSYGPDGTYRISNTTYLLAALSNVTVPPNTALDWGIPLLTMNYMVVDYDNQTFRLAPAEQGAYGGANGALPKALCKGVVAAASSAGVPSAASTSPALPPATSSPTSTSKPSHTNVGAIAGGVVGGVVGLLVIAILAFFLIRSRRREKILQQEHGSVGGSTAVAPQSQKDHTSQGVPGSPTEISEADHGNISQWLHSQDKFTTEQSTSPILGQPIEMPAHTPRDYKG